jgi:hypothetical protein
LGNSREVVRSPAISVKTWFKSVTDLAPEHTVPPPPPDFGTEKKYWLFGDDAMPDIVEHGVIPPLSELQPEVPEP